MEVEHCNCEGIFENLNTLHLLVIYHWENRASLIHTYSLLSFGIPKASLLIKGKLEVNCNVYAQGLSYLIQMFQTERLQLLGT